MLPFFRPLAGTGLGEPPQAAPSVFAQLDAYVWVKPPGESDGISHLENPDNVPDSQGKRFDPSCDPNNPALSALPGAPSAGGWFDSEFMMLLHNATPAVSASAPTPAPKPAP